MLKKAKAKLAAGETGATADLPQGVMDSSHRIWLAGLGAFSRAQREGTKVFESLVKQGEQLQDRTKQVATQTAGAAAAKAKEMQQMAGGTWDKLEQVFEDRVARALSKLGVYTQNDLQRLATRVDELAAAVNQLIKASGGKPAARAKAAPRTRRKSAVGRKSGVARKPAAK